MTAAGTADTAEARAAALVNEINSSMTERTGRSEGREGMPTRFSAGPHPVRIGILTPLSPPGDPTAGELVVRGACLGAQYVREHGGAGGRGIELLLRNDQATAATDGMPRSAAAGMAELAAIEDLVAVVGQWHLRTTPAVVDVATRNDVPIFIENGHSHVTAQQRRNVFRAYFSIADRVPVMLDFAAAQGMRRVGLVAADTVFGQMMADTLVEYGTSRHGMEFLRFDFAQDDTDDLTDQLKAVREYGPDLFINDGVIRTNYLIIQQAADVGILPGTPMMVTFGFPLRSDDFWRFSGRAGVGTMWPAMRYRPSWQGITEIGRWFVDRYTDLYGTFPPDTALTHFTDVTIIAKAVAAAGTDRRVDVLDALEALPFDTWQGRIRYERGAEHWHHVRPELALLQYQEYGQTFDDSAIISPPAVATAPYRSPT